MRFFAFIRSLLDFGYNIGNQSRRKHYETVYETNQGICKISML